MHFLYLDEAGISGKCSNHLLGGVIVNKKDWKDINDEIGKLKYEFFDTVFIDLKGLRRLNKKTIAKKHLNPFFSLSPSEIDDFSHRLNNIILDGRLTYITTCIDKKELNKLYPDKNDPYMWGYQFLVERFDLFLQKKDTYGMIILEFSNRKLKTSFENAHWQILDNGTGYQQIKRIVENCHFCAGSRNNFTQIADLFINAVFVNEEYDNSIFFNKYKPHVDCDETGDYNGYGLKRFPNR